MCARFSDEDVGKTVYNAADEEVGIVAEVEHGTAHVEPDPGITDTISAKLGWGDASEGSYPLKEGSVESVTDDAIHLKGDEHEGSMSGAEQRAQEGDKNYDVADDTPLRGEEGNVRTDDHSHADDDDHAHAHDDDSLIGDDDDSGFMDDDGDSRRTDDDDSLIGDDSGRREDDDSLIGDDDSGRTDDDDSLIGDDDDSGLMDDDDDEMSDGDRSTLGDSDDDDDRLGN